MELKSIQHGDDQKAGFETPGGDKNVISWISKDYEEFSRGKYWNFGMILLVIILAIGGIILNSWTFSLAIVVFAIVYYLIHKSSSTDLPVEISEIGVKIGNKYFPYAQISAFSLDLSGPSRKVIFYLKNDLLGERNLYLFETDPAIVKAYLIKKIPEVEKKSDTLVEMLNKLLKI
ncbi:MAG: hypothetical protein RBS56_04965 [Candidatus Gracilibacteria bacterium]|nr:hypothetical protein [Candidatus Gracilibacteria bacterium]